MKNILRFGINGNVLKTIALIAMVIDHIGFYFEPFLNTNIMVICRCMGRIAMPIFTYLVVQGFFHTSNFKKYIFRIGLWSVITQISICILMVINLKYVAQYTAAKYCYSKLNILFIYVISLLMMKILHEDLFVKKWDINKNLSLKVISTVLIFIICIFLPIDYNIEVPLLTLLFYFIEKLRIRFLINTEYIRKNMSKIIKVNEQRIIHTVYIFLLFMSLFLVVIYLNVNIYTMVAILPMALYNGERGKKSKILKKFFYIFFPLQHIILYSIAMAVTLT